MGSSLVIGTTNFVFLGAGTPGAGGSQLITVSPLESGFTQLFIVCNIGVQAGTERPALHLNADAGLNYRMTDTQMVPAGVTTVNVILGGIPLATAAAGIRTFSEGWINQPVQQTFKFCGGGEADQTITTGRWISLVEVSSITVTTAAQTMTEDSYINVYGVL